ncbi:MAG: metalloregulator ArsR/SmtB family transcription factor [Anaerolineae bacterium]
MAEDIFDLQAALCQTMSNATRIRILHALRDGPRGVTDLAAALHLTSAKTSQHLAALKSTGIVSAQRRGSEAIYRITNPKIERICDLMREVLAEQAAQRSELIRALQTK